MAQYPSFDPNDLQHYNPNETPIEDVTGNLEELYHNAAVQLTLEPGSTFKPLVISTALEAGVITPEDTFNCENGHYQFPHCPAIRTHILMAHSTSR